MVEGPRNLGQPWAAALPERLPLPGSDLPGQVVSISPAPAFQDVFRPLGDDGGPSPGGRLARTLLGTQGGSRPGQH